MNPPQVYMKEIYFTELVYHYGVWQVSKSVEWIVGVETQGRLNAAVQFLRPSVLVLPVLFNPGLQLIR